MELVFAVVMSVVGFWAWGCYTHGKRAHRASAFVAQIKPHYLHAVAHRTTAFAVEHAAHQRPYADQLECLVAIAERVEALSCRHMHPRFRLEARAQFESTIQLAAKAYGERIRLGQMTGLDAVDMPDELGEALARELGLRHVPRATLELPNDPREIFEARAA
jgi:hypothetical protein